MSERTPLVSVVVTVHDRDAYLPEALDSVLAQTWPGEVELLVVDDGSAQPVEPRFAARFPSVRWLRQEHAGVGAARRLGTSEARGELITWLDDDDVWMPERLELQTAFLRRRPEADLVCCDMLRFTAEGDASRGLYNYSIDALRRVAAREIPADPPGYLFAPGALLEYALDHDPFVPATMLVRREFLERVGGWDPSIRGSGDCHDLFLRVGWQALIGYQDRPLMKYRRGHAGHLTRGYLEPRCEEAETLCRVAAEYPPGLQARIRGPLARYLARIGAQCFRAGRYDLAARLYDDARRYGSLGAKDRVKAWLARRRR